jgi:glycosyltransferase involved in cell wall biosynthesis
MDGGVTDEAPKTVSVALCTCQGEQFLEEQLRSILDQTRPPDELILVDDASTDRTMTIAEAVLRDVPFDVHVVQNPARLGVAQNFEHAIALTTGDIVILSDQDDVWLPHKAQRLAQEFERHPEVGLVLSNAEVVDQSLASTGSDTLRFFARTRIPQNSEEVFTIVVGDGNAFPGMTMAFAGRYRRLLLDFPSFVAGDDPSRLLHDGWIAVALSAVAPVMVVREPLALYRQHPHQQIGARDRSSLPPRAVPFPDELRHEIVLREGVLHTLNTRCGRSDFQAYARGYLEQSITHLRFRSDMYERRGSVTALVREVATGRYRRYSNGWRSAARDVAALARTRDNRS